MFLNKVRNERDEGRFEARGEQMMHADYLADRRRWEESMARDMVAQEPEEMEEDMLPGMLCFCSLVLDCQEDTYTNAFQQTRRKFVH